MLPGAAARAGIGCGGGCGGGCAVCMAVSSCRLWISCLLLRCHVVCVGLLPSCAGPWSRVQVCSMKACV